MKLAYSVNVRVAYVRMDVRAILCTLRVPVPREELFFLPVLAQSQQLVGVPLGGASPLVPLRILIDVEVLSGAQVEIRLTAPRPKSDLAGFRDERATVGLRTDDGRPWAPLRVRADAGKASLQRARVTLSSFGLGVTQCPR